MNVGPAARVGALLAFAFLVACETGGVAQHSPTPAKVFPAAAVSPSAAPSAPLAVYDGPTLDGRGHVVYMVGIGDYGSPNCNDCSFVAKETAKVLFTARGAARTNPSGLTTGKAEDLPYVNTSATNVYFLDGDAKLLAVGRDGVVKTARYLPGTPEVHAAFAVSPDDARIAIALIDYSAHPIRETLFVEGLAGGGRVDITIAAGKYYWPVGWHAGQVVLAMGSPLSDGSIPANQYSATGYAVVDATAGAQPLQVGPGDCVPTGSLTPAGTACISKPGTPCLRDLAGTSGATSYYKTCLRRLDWSGQETTFLLPSSAGTTILATKHAALSIDGRRIVTDDMFLADEPGPSGYGTAGQWLAPFQIYPDQPGMGWIDANHVSLMFTFNYDGTSFQRIYSIGEGQYGFSNVVFTGYSEGFGFVPRSPVVGPLMGTLPGGL
jgi:hypothetical protein